MTGEELVEIAVKLSGLPPAKNRKGRGALYWLQEKFDVHQTTVSRWVRGRERTGSRVPRYVEDELRRLERNLDERTEHEHKDNNYSADNRDR